MASLCKAINAEFARKDDDNGRVVYRGVVDPEWTVMRYVWCNQASRSKDTHDSYAESHREVRNALVAPR